MPPLHVATTFIRDPDNAYASGFSYRIGCRRGGCAEFGAGGAAGQQQRCGQNGQTFRPEVGKCRHTES